MLASVLRKKVFSKAPVKWFSLYGSNNSDFFEISRMPLLQRFKITVWERHLFYKKIAIEVLNLCLFLQKKVFSRALLKWFSLYDWNYSDSLGISLFQEKGFYRSFEIVATLCKISFWRMPVKCFSLYGSYNSDSVVFWNATFEEIIVWQRHICKTKFQWKFWVFVYLTEKGICKRIRE